MIICDKHKIIYFSVPKIAHSSLMEMMHVLDTGSKFPHQRRNIYSVYHSKNFATYRLTPRQKKYFKFCVVRDPVQKFISCYNHRIVDEKRHYKNNSDHRQDHILYNQMNFKKCPSIEDVLDNFQNYRRNKDIEWHMRPQHKFLGKNSNFFDRVYNISEINNRLIPDLESITKKKITLTKENRGKVKKKYQLTEKETQKIKSIYKYDYEYYGEYF